MPRIVDHDARRGALVAAGHHRRPAWLLTGLAHLLAPNITAFDPGDGMPLAKCAIISGPAFERALHHGVDLGRGGPQVAQVHRLAVAAGPERLGGDVDVHVAGDGRV